MSNATEPTNPATEPTPVIEDDVSDTSSCISNDSDEWNQEYCVLCQKEKRSVFYYQLTKVKNAPICVRCVRSRLCSTVINRGKVPACKPFDVKHWNVNGIKGLQCCESCFVEETPEN
jgi:hypothetical protein